MNGHLLLVDASGFAFRAHYAWPKFYRESDGEPRGAVIGFMGMIWRMLGAAEADAIRPTHGAAVFDAPGKNFRHTLFPAYKANRDPARSLELEKQLPIMRPVADVLGLYPIELEGFEADDLIATLARLGREAGMLVTIVSSDKDFGQLVVDGQIEIVDPMQKRRVLAAGVEKKFGVPPCLVADVQALAGDSVDNIPGLPGVGLDTAAKLIRSAGGLDEFLHKPQTLRSAKMRMLLKKTFDLKVGQDGKAKLIPGKAKTGAGWVKEFRKLTTLRQDVAVQKHPSGMLLAPIMKSHIEDMMRALGASQHMEAVFALDPRMVRIVEAVTEKDEFAWWAEELKFPGQRIPELPQSGFYMRRLVLKGPLVAARIWREPETDPSTGEPTGRQLIRCTVGGEAKDPFAEWTRLSMSPISRGDYGYEIADADHAKKWRPGDPKANPRKSIDISAAPAPINPRRKRA